MKKIDNLLEYASETLATIESQRSESAEAVALMDALIKAVEELHGYTEYIADRLQAALEAGYIE